MNNYHPTLASTGTIVVGGLTLGQQSLVGAALIVVGVAALSIRVFWRRGKSLSEA